NSFRHSLQSIIALLYHVGEYGGRSAEPLTTVQRMIEDYTNWIRKMKHYEEALGVLYWDMRTGAPRKGLELRAETVGTLSAELFALGTAEQLGEWLERLTEPAVFASLTRIQQRSVEECKKEYDRSKKIPPELY